MLFDWRTLDFHHSIFPRRETDQVSGAYVDATTMEEYFVGLNLKKKLKGSCETKLVASVLSSLKDQKLTDPPNLPDKHDM